MFCVAGTELKYVNTLYGKKNFYVCVQRLLRKSISEKQFVDNDESNYYDKKKKVVITFFYMFSYIFVTYS